MKKKIIIISVSVVVLLCVGIGAYIVYRNQQEGTPEYSLKQLQLAIAAHNTAAASQYLDQNAIANAMWPRVASNALALPNFSSILGRVGLDSQQSSTIMTIEQSFYQYISGDSNTTYVGEILNGIFALPANQIRVTGATAAVPAVLQVGDYHYNVNVILTKQSGNYWMVTDMQGLELPVGSNWRDEQRGADYTQIVDGLELYNQKNGNFPTGVASWSDLERTLIAADPAVSLENDPLAGTDYPYYYGANASGSIIAIDIVFENPSQSTMLSSYTGNLPNGVTWLTGTPPEPCGTVTMWCFKYPK